MKSRDCEGLSPRFTALRQKKNKEETAKEPKEWQLLRREGNLENEEAR